MTAWAACTSTCPGGGSDRRTNSCADITSSLAADAICPAWASSTDVCEEHEGYGVALEAEVPQFVWHVHRIQRTGRDDPQRKLLLRTRPRCERSSGAFPCCVFIGNGARTRLKMAADMQQTFRSIIETAGGTVVAGTRRACKAQRRRAAAIEQQFQWAARSSMSSAPCAWEAIQRPRH